MDFGKKFVKMELLNKGWSSDKKYVVETADGERFLLRIADVAEYERKKLEFENMQRVVTLGIPMQQPVEFGVCNDGKSVYLLLTWVDGEDLEPKLPLLTETEQYVLGMKTGDMLRKIHSIPSPENIDRWETRYFAVMDERFAAYENEGVPFDGCNAILAYLEDNRHLLANRPQCRIHGDCHEGNLILSADGELSLVDWHTMDFESIADPWYEISHYYNVVDIDAMAINWSEVLAVYAVKVNTDSDNPAEVATLDNDKAERLRDVLNDMTSLSYSLKTETHEQTVTDEEGNETTETVEIITLVITLTQKSADEMAAEYGFNQPNKERPVARTVKPGLR
jgi:aminoglycoside phosphotransferase (APT) family kinase protein